MSVRFDFQRAAQQVDQVLWDAFGPNAAIRTEEGWHGRVHVKIVASDFDGKSEDQKQGMVWSVLRERLGEEAQAVSLVLAYGLDEV